MTPNPISLPVSLRIQVVLFNNAVAGISQLVQAIIAATSVARQEGSLDHIELAFGETSPDRCINDEQEAGILANAIDNGINEATYEFFNENLGSAGGSNRLAQGATTDLILVLNPDTYPSPWMLHRQIRAFRDDIGVVEARQLPLEHPKEYDPVTHDVSWGSGACTMFRREIFEAVGGYDTDHFFLHCDDVDLSWRIKLLGYRVVIAPSATTLHHKPLHISGAIRAPSVERYYGLLGKLMLATRFDAPEVIERSTEWIRKNGDEVQNDAVDEFETRRSQGRVPTVEPDAAKVAQFVGTEYARHRF